MENDITYHGCRMRPQMFAHPDGGFGARLIIWADGGASWTHLLVPTVRWPSEDLARDGILEMGGRVIEAERRKSIGTNFNSCHRRNGNSSRSN